MSFKNFIEEAGLKALAMAHLTQCEYSVMLYLLNCSVSGFQDLITTEQEIAKTIGYDIKALKSAIDDLAQKGFIVTKYPELLLSQPSRQKSIRIGMQYDMTKWNFQFDGEVHSPDAVIFPFMRGKNLQLINGTSPTTSAAVSATIDKAMPTWQRVHRSFLDGRELVGKKLERSEQEAKILAQTHPIDQILLFLRHFGQRIPTLSLLASSWQHYEELYENETQKVDLLGARQKHNEQDNQVREHAIAMLEQKDDHELSSEEIAVLETLASHNHPRRQLFWAYQTRGRYPKLRNFFKDNKKYMLPVTTNGSVVKKGPHRDS